MAPMSSPERDADSPAPEPAPVFADEAAIAVLFAGAMQLPLGSCRELARRLTERVVVECQNQSHDLHPTTARDARFVRALRFVAEVVDHPPSTTEYTAEYERRRALEGARIPSTSAVLKHFSGWPYALAAAGLAPDVAPTGIQRRRN